MTNANHKNRLANETSPYLLQHADNPVAWYPWDQEALNQAKQENKPILLSIGYSACHWCHVMAHESFEDESTAEIMNRLFINIKVDREERPDLDKIYQSAHHLLNQRGGGWPLTVFLTPDDQTPFFAGTYFPNTPRHGIPAFRELLQQVADFHHEHEDEIRVQNQSLTRAMQDIIPSDSENKAAINAAPLNEARHQLAHNFDRSYGGFGQAPKFPHPTDLERLMRHWHATALTDNPDNQARDMVRLTLHAMASGGIYDQLGGGFCRYSVDEKWMIPHFEKMLYDNGPLLSLYTKAWLAWGDNVFQRIALETAEWVMREMQSPEGSYYSTLDADSEGEEGKFYVWTPAQVKQCLNETEFKIVERIYGFDKAANFEGNWHLHVYSDTEQVAAELGMEQEQLVKLLNTARIKLLNLREQRIRPGRDEKILTAWNGLMIKGMACVGRHLQREDFIYSAQQSLDFIRHTLFVNGRLLASYKDGVAKLDAYLDDHVFLISGILELLQAQWRDEDLEFAISLTEVVLEHFADQQAGGFYFTADDHEKLFHRPKPVMDEAVPAGNGIAAQVLTRLGHLLGETRYLEAAEATLLNGWASIQQAPYAHCALLLAVEEYLYPPQTIIIRGERDTTKEWLARCRQHYAPRRMSFVIPPHSQSLPGLLAERKPQGEHITYICSGTVCQPPVSTLADLDASLAGTESVP